eukprot:CAMPEP_0202900434 /NCGR_PEP_ID=MMETSP1392-20130828/11639_1 /ASSEMBLY_ACC=CAM_ASM_000868 /TAXON_ID=225041 /ORGANISM="Chlamydomonas chlamydogama, Strain SAG 11-48b" /LENGTH=420 /DNA_ID=CAMNT_0049586817 /DNA_START=80 /DNA_END=1342 /DNA_ORIENTATION=-
MTVQLVETEEDSFLLVAQHVANLLNEGQAKTALAETPGSRFLDECTDILSEERFADYLKTLSGHLDLVFGKSSEKDAECVANILVHAVPRVPEDKLAETVKVLTAALSSKVDERADERLAALLNLYGVTSGVVVQYPVLLALSEFARKSPKLATNLAVHVRGRVEEWIKSWGLSDAQARELYITIALLVKASQDKAAGKEFLRLISLALALAAEGDAAALAALKPHAVSALQEFLRSSTTYQCDLAELPAVRQLSSDSQYAPLYKLLVASLSGDITAYKAAATPAALELAGAAADASLYKARMTALLALGSRSAHQQVPFSDIQKALDIPADQVEVWVVRAIGSKLLECKIDQVHSAVTINRCTLRTFSNSDWAGMRTKLAAWRDSLAAVQHNLAVNKAAAPQGLGMPPPARTQQQGIKA